MVSGLLSLVERLPRSSTLRRRLRGRLRGAIGGLQQLETYVDLYGPYARLRCTFETKRLRELRRSLTAEDRESFFCDPRVISWKTYMQGVHIPGLRKHVLRLERDVEAGTGPRAAPGAARPAADDAERPGGEEARAISLTPGAVLAAPSQDRPRTSRAEALLDPPRGALLLRGAFRLFQLVCLDPLLSLRAEGVENVPESGPFILAANHCSHLDTAVIRRVLGRRAGRLRVMAARDYFFDTRLKSWFFRAAFNTLPLDRGGGGLAGLRLCREVLRRGDALLLFPEGTRSRDGRLGAFKRGIGLLAVESGCPVLPVRIEGTFRALPRGRRWPRPSRVRVVIGPPVDLRDFRAGGAGGVEVRRAALRRAGRAALTIQDAVAALAGETS